MKQLGARLRLSKQFQTQLSKTHKMKIGLTLQKWNEFNESVNKPSLQITPKREKVLIIKCNIQFTDIKNRFIWHKRKKVTTHPFALKRDMGGEGRPSSALSTEKG